MMISGIPRYQEHGGIIVVLLSENPGLHIPGKN
jgi:hypothetical protein